MTDPIAAAYETVAAEYVRGRPDYPTSAVQHLIAELGLDPGSVVLDLGAGTGKLTALLANAGLTTIALDPSRAMLDQLQTISPTTRVIAGTAEAIPLTDGSVAAVTAAQAFHWFDAPAALDEINRVLRTTGGLALIWNRRDTSDPIQALLAEMTDPPQRATPRGWKLDVPHLLAQTSHFTPVVTAEFPHVQTVDDTDELISRLLSSSYVAGLPKTSRTSLVARLRAELARLRAPIDLHYTTVVHTALRR